jgi:hypothetical protein
LLDISGVAEYLPTNRFAVEVDRLLDLVREITALGVKCDSL